MRDGLRAGLVSAFAVAVAFAFVDGGAGANPGDALREANEQWDDCAMHLDEPHNLVTEFGQHATVAAVRVRCKHGHPNGSVIIAEIQRDDTEDTPVAQKFCPIDEIKEGQEYTCRVAAPRRCDGVEHRRQTDGRLGHTGLHERSTWFTYRCD